MEQILTIGRCPSWLMSCKNSNLPTESRSWILSQNFIKSSLLKINIINRVIMMPPTRRGMLQSITMISTTHRKLFKISRKRKQRYQQMLLELQLQEPNRPVRSGRKSIRLGNVLRSSTSALRASKNPKVLSISSALTLLWKMALSRKAVSFQRVIWPTRWKLHRLMAPWSMRSAARTPTSFS